MDENGKLVLNNYCVFEIIDYIIANCKAKPKNEKDGSINYDDLINFVLANEFFLGLLEERHKSLYDDLEMAIVCRINKLLIDLRINKQSEAETEFFWKSYIQSVSERSPFNAELSFGHAFVNIDIQCKCTEKNENKYQHIQFKVSYNKFSLNTKKLYSLLNISIDLYNKKILDFMQVFLKVVCRFSFFSMIF